MAGTHLAFTLLVLAGLGDIQANLNAHNGSINAKAHLDPKRRSEIVNEAFLEQKDSLLELLETKLKEVREKRKKSFLNDVAGNGNFNNGLEHLSNLNLKINGISAIGDANMELKYGPGKSLIHMDANGISNIGKVHLELGTGDIGLSIPGLSDLFLERGHVNCTKNATGVQETEKAFDSQRLGEDIILRQSNPGTVPQTYRTTLMNHGSANKNSTIQIWNTPGSTSTDAFVFVPLNSTTVTGTNSTV